VSDATPDPLEAVAEAACAADDEQPPVADEVTGTEREEVLSVESLLTDLERVTAERDSYLRLAQEKQAELENFRKRVMKQQADEVARATGRVVDTLLPVLDAFDYAAAHGEESLKPMRDQLLGALEKEGLARLESDGATFDPTVHEAVAHEPADGEEHDGPIVAETMRAGYLWQGQLLRPAMVKVKG
jgi:molecular chaperone GrpE